MAHASVIGAGPPEHLANRGAGHRHLIELSGLREVVGDQGLERPVGLRVCLILDDVGASGRSNWVIGQGQVAAEDWRAGPARRQ